MLHTFYAMRDNSYLAFFEAPNMPFLFKEQHDFDLHIALQVDKKEMLKFYSKGISRGIETRGISDHGFIESIYFRDPNGYVIELTAIKKQVEQKLKKDPHQVLSEWIQNR